MSKGEYSVYVHISPSGKMYIGITKNTPEERWKNGLGYRRQNHFYRAIKKYGWDNFYHEVVRTGLSEQEAKDLEIELIRIFTSTDKRLGYNTTSGGDGCRGYDPPGEVREKISAANKGKTRTMETRRRIAVAKTGTRASDETRRKLSQNHSDVSGERNPMYGKTHSEETRRKMSENRQKKQVLQFTLDGKFVGLYASTREAERRTGISNTVIIRCCKNRQITAGGFVWKYETEVENECMIPNL